MLLIAILHKLERYGLIRLRLIFIDNCYLIMNLGFTLHVSVPDINNHETQKMLDLYICLPFYIYN